MDVNEFLTETVKTKEIVGFQYQEFRPRVFCKNGVSLSVQASQYHYCWPRVDGVITYESVEVGYPSVNPPESWIEYYDGEVKGPTCSKDSVFGYIPVELVDAWIEKNGGIDVEKTFEDVNDD